MLQTWLYHADFLGTLVAPLFRVPLVWNIRCSNMNLKNYSKLTAWVVGWCAKRSLRPHAIIVNSETGKSFHINMGYHPHEWTVIPNGFDLDRFRHDESCGNIIKQELNLSEEVTLIGLVARYEPLERSSLFYLGCESSN